MNSSARLLLPRSNVVLLVLALVAFAPHGEGKGEDGFERVASSASVIAVDGDLLVWAQTSPGRVDLMSTDLRTREVRLLMGLPGATALRDLDHDGTTVCWIDDRLQTSDVFLLDLATGRKEQLSDDAGWEVALDVADGHVAWAGAAGLQLHAFANGTTWRIAQEDSVGDVALDGETVFWAKTADGERRLERAALDGRDRRTVDDDDGHFVHHLDFDAGLLVWHVQVLADGHVGIGGYQVRFLAEEGTVGNLSSEGPVAILGPWTGAGRVAWIELTTPRTVHVVDATGSDVAQHHVPAQALALTEDQLVVLLQDGTILARPWTRTDSSSNGIPTPAFLFAVAGLALAAGRRRR